MIIKVILLIIGYFVRDIRNKKKNKEKENENV
jgi:hypothetical protein